MKFIGLLAFFGALLTGCTQVSNDDCALRTIPTTNNPYVIPNHGGAIPGISSMR